MKRGVIAITITLLIVITGALLYDYIYAHNYYNAIFPVPPITIFPTTVPTQPVFPSPSSNEMSCTTDNQCMVVHEGCCGEVPINKSYAAAYGERITQIAVHSPRYVCNISCVRPPIVQCIHQVCTNTYNIDITPSK